MRQIITPNPHIPCKPGWCLQYVRQTFGLAGVYPSATAGWAASRTKHRDQNFPAGVWLPLWFFMEHEPLGHVVLRAPDGSIYSTSDLSTTPRHHPNLAHLMAHYAYWGLPLTYLGWTEDIEDVAVVDGSAGLAYAGTITPIQSEEDDFMATPEQIQAFFDHQITTSNGSKMTLGEMIGESRPGRTDIVTAIKAVPAAVLSEPFPRIATNGQPDGLTNLRDVIGASEANVVLTRGLVGAPPAVVVDSLVAAGIAESVADLLAERLAK